MITIHQPRISQDNGQVILSAFYEDDVNNIHTDIFYRTTEEYGQYFCDTIADPFVLLALLPAIKSSQDIRVCSGISTDLAFSLESGLIHMFSSLYNTTSRHIRILPDRRIRLEQNGKAIGCGCSLGVDSLSAIKRYTSAELPSDYRITHLTFFNIGALGEFDYEQAHQSYLKELKTIQSFAGQVSLPLVTLESNSSVLFINQFNFNQSHTIRNASAVLTLNGLFGKYYYASAFPIDETHLSDMYMGHMDSILLPLLSTRSIKFLSADPDKQRTEKTRYIAFDKLTTQYLNVCWKDIISNGNPKYAHSLNSIPFVNCTRCDKCLRTALTLDILGNLDQFGTLFDINYYFSQKKSYLYKVLSEKDNNLMYKQISDLIESTSFEVPKTIKYKLLFKKMHCIWLWNLLRKIRSFFIKR